MPPAVMRRGVRLIGRRCLDPTLPWPVQRTRLGQFFRFPLMPRGTTVTEQVLGGVPATAAPTRTSSAGTCCSTRAGSPPAPRRPA